MVQTRPKKANGFSKQQKAVLNFCFPSVEESFSQKLKNEKKQDKNENREDDEIQEDDEHTSDKNHLDEFIRKTISRGQKVEADDLLGPLMATLKLVCVFGD